MIYFVLVEWLVWIWCIVVMFFLLIIMMEVLFGLCVMVCCGIVIVCLFMVCFRWVCMYMFGSSVWLVFGIIVCSVIVFVVGFIVRFEKYSLFGWVQVWLLFVMSVILVVLLLVLVSLLFLSVCCRCSILVFDCVNVRQIGLICCMVVSSVVLFWFMSVFLVICVRLVWLEMGEVMLVQLMFSLVVFMVVWVVVMLVVVCLVVVVVLLQFCLLMVLVVISGLQCLVFSCVCVCVVFECVSCVLVLLSDVLYCVGLIWNNCWLVFMLLFLVQVCLSMMFVICVCICVICVVFRWFGNLLVRLMECGCMVIMLILVGGMLVLFGFCVCLLLQVVSVIIMNVVVVSW